MRRRFIADTWSPESGHPTHAALTGEQAAHLARVLREELESDTALPIHLLLAVFKFDHFEWAVEKATELGVARITPILARRTEKHLAHASAKRVERWRRIALEASKQSRRTTIPDISDPSPLAPALAAETAPARILLSETEQQLTLAAALNLQPVTGNLQLSLAIGPEGGWAPDEMALFTDHNWTHVTLGPRILRAETAAIAALAIAGSHLAERASS